jgi:hypothetical protein
MGIVFIGNDIYEDLDEKKEFNENDKIEILDKKGNKYEKEEINVYEEILKLVAINDQKYNKWESNVNIRSKPIPIPNPNQNKFKK